MKANASGMPAKLAATPEKVVRTVRTTRGVPSRMAAYAIRKPRMPPASAVTRLTSIEFLKALTIRLVEDLAHVRGREAAVERLEGAESTCAAGRSRKSTA